MRKDLNDGTGGSTAAALGREASVRTPTSSCTPTCVGSRRPHSQTPALKRGPALPPEGSLKAERTGVSSLLALWVLLAAFTTSGAPAKSTTIPMDQIGAVAGKQYQGDGLSVAVTREGAQLRCVFQKLEGHATPEGLWLTSTTDSSKGERFRVVARALERESAERSADTPLGFAPAHHGTETRVSALLPNAGKVELAEQMVRFVRPGLIEEYTVSVDGVRQDFIIERPPLNSQPSTFKQAPGQLRVELDVTGARAKPLINGVRLVLDGSGRKIAYSRLRAADATGRELTARIEVEVMSVANEVTWLESDVETRNQNAEMSQSLLT